MKTKEQLKIVMLLSFVLFYCAEVFAQEKEVIVANSVVHDVNDKDLQWGPCPEFMPGGCEIAILNGDPAKRNADILFKIPANAEIPNHAHTSAERMVLISGELDVTYEGEPSRKLQPGSYAYGPAKKPHTGRCGDSGPCVLFIAFEEPLDAYVVQK